MKNRRIVNVIFGKIWYVIISYSVPNWRYMMIYDQIFSLRIYVRLTIDEIFYLQYLLKNLQQ